MCLYLKKTFPNKEAAKAYMQNPPLTKRNIVVWKGLERHHINPSRNTLKSPYNSFIYEKGNHYYQTGQKFTFSISKGYNGRYSVTINRGLHACISSEAAHKHGSHAVEMVIPKGSILFRGMSNDIVTDNLIWE